MKVVDANVLLYAVDADTTHHEGSRRWLDAALGGADTVGFTWLALTAFIRIPIKIGIFPSPLSSGEACEQVRSWLEAPGARVLEPTGQHITVLERLLRGVGSGGNLVSDAHLAAIAIEHGADIVSYDDVFGRFQDVRWHRPDRLG
ncbi:MAG: type II toxin-antitoxin system VapC family toxin [Actinomycetales bacterium]